MKLKGPKAGVMAVASAALVVAAVVSVVPLARERSQNAALGRQWAGLLKNHPTFSGRRPSPTVDVTFTYATPTDENLARLRKLYNLDAIAGQRPEAERIINLMRWVYRLTGHANEQVSFQDPIAAAQPFRSGLRADHRAGRTHPRRLPRGTAPENQNG